MGGLGLRSAQRTPIQRFWASWADSLAMIRQYHPDAAGQLVHELEGHPDTPCMQAAANAARSFHGVCGFVLPSWEALSHGVRPQPMQPDEFALGCQRGGWQHEAASRVEALFRDDNFFNRLDSVSKAMVRSQGGVGAGLAFSSCLLYRVTRLEPHLFRVLLLRRLRLPLAFSGRSCWCGFPLNSSGHHRAACARAGILGRRGFALESVAARICREAGGRVTTNVMVLDLDLAGPNLLDARRLEVVVSSWLWTPLVNTTPQMTSFRGAKRVHKMATGKSDDELVQHDKMRIWTRSGKFRKVENLLLGDKAQRERQ